MRLFCHLRFSTFPWMYLFAGIFRDAEMAFISYVCINLFISVNTILTTCILYFLGQISMHNPEVRLTVRIRGNLENIPCLSIDRRVKNSRWAQLNSVSHPQILSPLLSFSPVGYPGNLPEAELRLPHLPPVQLWEWADGTGQRWHRGPDSQWLWSRCL